MIGYLQGRPLKIGTDTLILLVQGVGYELHCSQSTLADAEGKTLLELWVHTHVREDALSLFGFSTELEKKIFTSLLKVNGIGPKSAINVLSGARPSQIVQWIDEANVKALSSLPKIGKKSAEQIILTLQGSLVRTSDLETKGFQARPQIVSALVNLGFRLADVEKVVDQMVPATEFSDGIRQGLSALTS
jgi:Holliday junction DNA helicase RuvA